MFKIMVDEEEHSRYDEKEWVWIDVGSAADAEVRLPWADAQHLSIYPCSYGHFLVAIHSSTTCSCGAFSRRSRSCASQTPLGRFSCVTARR